MRRQGGGLVGFFATIKNLIGVFAVFGVFYLTIPWRLIRVVTSGNELTTDMFITAIREWAIGLVDNILLLVLLLFIAILTYGPKVLNLVAGPDKPNSPRF